MKPHHINSSTLACCVLLFTSTALPLFAAEEALDEIVVTAQRRAERLQDVPEAITALSGDSLNELHLQGNADLASQVPSLSFAVLGPGESTLAIRGLGTSYGLAPPVSYYVNETPIDIRTDGYAGAPDIDFFDIARIEVLRGPQGTLYGSSSMGGALRVLTAQPDPAAFAVNAEFGGSSVEGGGAGYLAKSAVNLPLASDAAVRVVGTYEHVPGYINRVTPGDYTVAHPNDPVVQRRINDADLKGGRILGLWKPLDELTISPSVMISQVNAASNSEYFSNLPRYSVAGYYPTPQNSRLVVGNLSITYDAGFANLLSSTSAISRNVETLGDFSLFFANFAPVFGLTYPPAYPGAQKMTTHRTMRASSRSFVSLRPRISAYAGLQAHISVTIDSTRRSQPIALRLQTHWVRQTVRTCIASINR